MIFACPSSRWKFIEVTMTMNQETQTLVLNQYAEKQFNTLKLQQSILKNFWLTGNESIFVVVVCVFVCLVGSFLNHLRSAVTRTIFFSRRQFLSDFFRPKTVALRKMLSIWGKGVEKSEVSKSFVDYFSNRSPNHLVKLMERWGFRYWFN